MRMKRPDLAVPASTLLFEPLEERDRKILAGELRWEQWLTALEEYIRTADPYYRAFVHWNAISHPREGAVPAGTGAERPPFLVTYKDTIDVAGFPTRLGNLAGYRHYPVASATIAEILHTRRILPLGKVATTEFGIGAKLPSINPRFPKLSPGGSSTGSAVAVAAGFCDFSIGTDNAGSVRWPAGHCGIIGLKLGHAPHLLPGIFVVSPQMESVGIMTRTAADLAYIWEREDFGAALGLNGHSLGTRSDRLRFATLANCEETEWHPDVRAAWERLLADLAAAGFGAPRKTVQWWRYRTQGWLLIWREAYDAHQAFRKGAHVEYDPGTWTTLLQGQDIDDERYQTLREDQTAAATMAQADLAAGEVDVLLTPLRPELPRGLHEPAADWRINPGFTIIASFARIPALTLPIALSASGAPISVQLLARRGGEADLIRAGLLIERIIARA